MIHAIISCVGFFHICVATDDSRHAAAKEFERLHQADWQLVFDDPCTRDWRAKWTLDGEKAMIMHSPQGMDFRAGPEWKDDAHHAVLWTKQSFEGDLRIEYDYTRTDEADRAVTILYVQATGEGELPYEKDIAAWAHLRKVPSMPTYWRNMHTLHLSYAAFGTSKDDPEADYIRARRYIPGPGANLRGTELRPDYFEPGLFETGVPHRLTVIKVDDNLFMQIRNEQRIVLCHWKNTSRRITEGRIGLRHMCTRGARYKDFRVSTLKSSDQKPQ